MFEQLKQKYTKLPSFPYTQIHNTNEDSDSSEDLEQGSSYGYHLVGSEPAATHPGHEEDDDDEEEEEEDDMSGLSMEEQVGVLR